MRVTGTTYIYYDSFINGKLAQDMTDQERNDFAKSWKEKHGGEVVFVERNPKK